MSDAEVERALRTGDQLGMLEDLFGAPALDELRRLSRDAEATGVRGGDRVLILPGIMGSKLGFPGPLIFNDTIWVDPAAIALGRLSELELQRRAGTISALGVILFAYLALKLRLRIRGHAAEFFPFDWRLSLDQLGRQLTKQLSDGKRTHLVCHSMGGLVARAMLANGAPANLGRLITVGTPHNGSYSPVQAFRGVYSIVRKLAALDLSHDQTDLAKIFGTFPGLLQMIPSPKLRPNPNLFDPGAWPRQGARPDDRMLKAALSVQEGLPDLGTVKLPPLDNRIVLIVGRGSETVVGARLQSGNDEFVYDLSPDGDGTVPLDLAVVPGLPTYVTAASHGGMPNDANLAQALDNIITTGTTKLLPTLEASAAAQRGSASTRSISDSELSALGPLPDSVRGGMSVRDQRELLTEVAAPPTQRDLTLPQPRDGVPSLTTGATAMPTPGAPPSATAASSRGLVVGRRQQQRLELTLAHGSITEADADAYVLGAFRGVAPAGAAAAVDAALIPPGGTGGPISELIARRMISGGVGEITALPVNRTRRVRADAILLAGLGNIGEYTDSVLEAVGESIMRTALLSRFEDFAVVPIGASAGTPSRVAVQHLVQGFMKVLRGAEGIARLRGFTICETDDDRYREIGDTLYQLLRTSLFDDVEITLTTRILEAPAVRVGAPSVLASGPDPVYLLVQQELDGSERAHVVGTVLTAGGKASIIKLSHELDVARLENLLAKIRQGSQGIGNMAKFGSELSQIALPPDLLTVLARETTGKTPAPLVVVHDAAMSRVPWEALHLKVGEVPVAPALLGGLSHRYNGGMLSVAKWMEERVQSPDLSVLLVVDPTENLEGARREGDRVRTLIEQKLPRATLKELRGPEARRSELLACFGTGNYDVVHYAGHAYFDVANRSRSGILCYGNEVLSGADLASLTRLPTLVVFNGCESARVRRVISPGEDKVVQEEANEFVGGTVSFAEAFLAGGVANYVGTYWPVGDAAASSFAETFYGELLVGKPISEALLNARLAVSRLQTGGADWADYVFYGDPRFVLKAARGNQTTAQGRNSASGANAAA
jgi:pimeloyl-ACP methyl ester carboxylesterase